MIRGTVSEYIPNPTFEVVAKPGAQEEYFRNGNPEGKSYREIIGEPMRAIPAFHHPEPRHRGDERAGGRQDPHVPHLGQPARGAHAGRPGTDTRRDPLAERVDVRGVDLQLRGSDLRHARDHTADRREGDRRARVGPRAGGEDGPDPARAGAGVPGLSLVRVPRVRPVLAGRGGCGHPRVDALLRQWLHPVHERLDRPERDAALQARLVPLHDRRSPADPGRHGRLRLPRRVRTFSRAPGRLDRGRRGMDSRVRPAPRRHPQEDAARLRRGPGRAVQAERLRQSRSTRTTSAPSST